jgi:hypothetical protein
MSKDEMDVEQEDDEQGGKYLHDLEDKENREYQQSDYEVDDSSANPHCGFTVLVE